ncbi:MAG TPA: hypothetical protein VK986_23925 [Tepidisphaeraceae bacterium]|nr:hypothetical protein [Tepidisphaeraceae bacterium]
MAIRQEANTPLIVTIGIVSALLLVVTTFGVEAWFLYEEEYEVQEKWKQSRNVALDDMRAEQTANITTKAKKPISEAMKDVVTKYGATRADAK